MKAESNIQVFFATSALGMGVDVPYVTQIIHVTPLHDLEGYMQEGGRGARVTNEAVAVLYYNNPVGKMMHGYYMLEQPSYI